MLLPRAQLSRTHANSGLAGLNRCEKVPRSGICFDLYNRMASPTAMLNARLATMSKDDEVKCSLLGPARQREAVFRVSSWRRPDENQLALFEREGKRRRTVGRGSHDLLL